MARSVPYPILRRHWRRGRRRAGRFGRRVAGRLPTGLRVPAVAAARALRVIPQIKVSVIIPTHNSDQYRLEQLMASLHGQSMPAREIEIVFVDDGSTDDTRHRLDTLTRGRPNVIIRSIPNSGWPSRPRNIGIGLAHGQYLLFMDHDDVLFPRSLERAYEFGRRARADIVNAKEIRTVGWSWGWDSFVADVPRATRTDPNPLIPMTPHKLYRRRFVLRSKLRFPEGRRVFWEDIFFNVAAYARNPRVAILSSTPFYHWVSTGTNNSRSYGHPDQEFWNRLSDLLAYQQRELAGVQGSREQLVHQIRGRVLPFVGPGLLRETGLDFADILRHTHELVTRYAPPELDVALTSVERCRIELVRAERPDLLRRLADIDRGVTAVATLDEVRWEGRELVLSASTVLVDANGTPVRLQRDGDRWFRTLPDVLGEALSTDAREVTGDLRRAAFRLSVKGRATRSNWPISGEGTVQLVADDEAGGILRATITTRFDPIAFAADHDLDDPVWDFAARFSAIGYTAHRELTRGHSAAALLAGVPAAGYVNRSGCYSLDVAASTQSVIAVAGTTPSEVEIEAAPADGNAARVRVRVALPAMHCFGDTALTGIVLVGPTVRAPATLQTDRGRAVLAFEAIAPAGSHPLRARFLGRTGALGLVLTVQNGAAAVAAADD